MNVKIGQKALVTTSEWFYAPDGAQYRAVFGTIKGIFEDDATLGIKTNSKSTNWYLEIGNMIVAGCQIHYAVMTDEVSFEPHMREIEHEGKLITSTEIRSRIYNADR